jgi:hypothetical protein
MHRMTVKVHSNSSLYIWPPNCLIILANHLPAHREKKGVGAAVIAVLAGASLHGKGWGRGGGEVNKIYIYFSVLAPSTLEM